MPSFAAVIQHNPTRFRLGSESPISNTLAYVSNSHQPPPFAYSCTRIIKEFITQMIALLDPDAPESLRSPRQHTANAGQAAANKNRVATSQPMPAGEPAGINFSMTDSRNICLVATRHTVITLAGTVTEPLTEHT